MKKNDPVNFPASQSEQASYDAVAEAFPAAHSSHPPLPSGCEPGAHPHSVKSALLNLPEGQEEHEEDPAEAAILPDWQEVQKAAPEDEYFPTPQSLQEPPSTILYFPLMQFWQPSRTWKRQTHHALREYS